jgi:hypothetical protein
MCGQASDSDIASASMKDVYEAASAVVGSCREATASLDVHVPAGLAVYARRDF